MAFCSTRLDVARKRSMLSKKAFAEACEFNTHTLTQWEKGETCPSEATVSAIARVTGFPNRFFYESEIDLPESASFRSYSRMTHRIREASLSAGAIGFLLSNWIEQRFNVPNPAIPDLSNFEPQAAARVLREEWILGEKPIHNMLHLLEAKGVRVFSLSEQTAVVKSFAVWKNERPFVFLNTFKSAESSRFDAAHELGHLVLHSEKSCVGKAAEREADLFAASFLMPESDVLSIASSAQFLKQIVQLKKRWRVSLAALTYRLHKLGVLSDWRYRDICIEMSKNGYNKNEPEPMPRENSVIWRKIVEFLWRDGKSLDDVGKDLFIPQREIESMIYGLICDNRASIQELRFKRPSIV